MAFIVEALKSNGTLTSLSCGGNDMSPFGTLPFLAQTLGGRNAPGAFVVKTREVRG